MRILIDALKTFSICLVFLAMASIASASSIDQLQPASSAGKPASDIEYTDTVIFPSIKVGAQGVGGVTFFNGTIVNATTGDNDVDNPVTFGDNVRIDGRVYRGATAGPDDDMSFTINDNLVLDGSKSSVNLKDFRKKNIGFVFQKSNLIPFLTARENIQIALDINGHSKRNSQKMQRSVSNCF